MVTQAHCYTFQKFYLFTIILHPAHIRMHCWNIWMYYIYSYRHMDYLWIIYNIYMNGCVALIYHFVIYYPKHYDMRIWETGSKGRRIIYICWKITSDIEEWIFMECPKVTKSQRKKLKTLSLLQSQKWITFIWVEIIQWVFMVGRLLRV